MSRYGLSEETIVKIIDTIKRCDRVEGILLYGSRAQGRYREFSDIDLTLTGDSLTRDDLIRIISEIDDLLLPYEIDISLYKDIDYVPLLREIQRTAIPLA
ncbi:MAG: nucleotidyltransferase domain-containing protein [Muribaculaceae bacterium]|nr:nucleotidyltransferase domain-containing protein [Muribaculaceae bacterium]